MGRPINFVEDRSVVYAGVQGQLLDLIDRLEPAGAKRLYGIRV